MKVTLVLGGGSYIDTEYETTPEGLIEDYTKGISYPFGAYAKITLKYYREYTSNGGTKAIHEWYADNRIV